MMKCELPGALEVWGGLECTVNRVGDQYFDQFARTGHDSRISDLDLVAGLGIRTLRYPALWEWAEREPRQYDWSWADTRLERLAQLGICPIVGLLHHGSGPRDIDLLNAAFPERFTSYAKAFAERFPDIEFYTPINEPLTTARFSALYGHWYPHHHDGYSFAKACLSQYRATVLAMNAIRNLRPDAKLVQTEDLGKTFSSPSLAYQADFENARRWLTFDMLTGRVDRHHVMGEYFLWLGIREAELKWFQDHRCPPDILGVNYYVTSERFLDRRFRRHPKVTHGGNERHRYADVEAVRMRPQGLAGIQSLLLEAWKRFRLPLAVTEVHLACGREDQLRWLWEIWRGAQGARRLGADVRAVTAWSLLGAYDWDSLVTQPRGHYEPGAFDVRGPQPRATALAGLIKELATTQQSQHPLLAQPGWWKRPERRSHPSRRGLDQRAADPSGRPIIIIGGDYPLGTAFYKELVRRAIPSKLISSTQWRLTDSAKIEATFDTDNPWAVINAAGYGRIDAAERNAGQCHHENVDRPTMLATVCRKAHIPFVTFSSDLVFDGMQRVPYTETDNVNPLGVFGRTKAESERRVLDSYPEALVVRTSTCFSTWDLENFISISHRALLRREPCLILDGVVSPTYLPDLVGACLDLLIDRASGIWHLAGDGEISWAQLVEELATRAGLARGDFQLRYRDRDAIAPRPPYSALRSERGQSLPAWHNALDRYFLEAGDLAVPPLEQCTSR